MGIQVAGDEDVRDVVVDEAAFGVLTLPMGGVSQTLIVSSGQTSNGLNIVSGGTVAVLSGGVANASMISNGGLENVYGSASGTVVSGGGLYVVYSGGIASA